MNNVIYYIYYWLLRGYNINNILIEDTGYSHASVRCWHFVPTADNIVRFTVQGYIDGVL